MATALQYQSHTNSFLERLSDHHILSHKKSFNLIRAAQNGCQQSRNTLIESNMRLIMKQAHKYRNAGFPLSDLVQEGVIGLIKAIEKFDCSLDNQFSTYATWWIRHQLSRTIANKARILRIPVHLHDKLTKLRQFSREVYKRTGSEPTLDDIAEQFYPIKMDKLERRIQKKFPAPGQAQERKEALKKAWIQEKNNNRNKALQLTNLNVPTLSYDQTLFSESNLTLLDSIQSEQPTLAETLERQDLREAFAKLEPEAQKVLDLRYGLYSCDSCSYQKIAETLELSLKQVKAIHRKALKAIKSLL